MADHAEDEIIDRWCSVLPDGRREQAGWRFACPVCGLGRRLSVRAKGRGPVWKNHCGCDRADVRAKLTALGLVRPRRRTLDRDDLIALALADLPPTSLRLGLLELAGIPTGEALARLGVGPTHKNRVITPLRKTGGLPILVRNPRSPPLPILVTRKLANWLLTAY